MLRFRLLLPCLAALGSIVGSRVDAAEPLHVRIDRLISVAAGEFSPAPPASDAEFLRRVYLDLAGRIPTSLETTAFLDDGAADKRAKLIDRLLASPDYPRRMQELFHVMLMERRGDDPDWEKFLRRAFEQNLPWDQLAQSILHPDPESDARRGAAYFYTARLVSEGAMAPVDVPGLTRDVGRLLAGVDLQCAECHDHVDIDDYKQKDFQGLQIVFENLQKRGDLKFPAVGEKVLSERRKFMSVFTQVPMETGPVIPGRGEVELVVFPKGEEYAVEPDRKARTPGVPKFSPLQELATGLAAADNQPFCRNIVNRLWFVMLGRGLVEPLDLHHSGNPASHPELLELLAEEFAAHQFDIQWLLRELALSETYQRSGVLPSEGSPPPPQSFLVANEKRLSAEQLFWSTLIATGEFERQRQLLQDEERATESLSVDAVVQQSEPLKTLQATFVKTFANAPKDPETEFAPTVKAALFLMHDERVWELLSPEGQNITGRLAEREDDREVCQELFLAFLSRLPTDEEAREVGDYLASHRPERSEALRRVAWALLASTEFCVNH